MTHLNFLPGKDASLEETINIAETRLDSLGLQTECASWLNPAPDCWSVHLQIKDVPWLYTNGKGCSRSACYASALGELFERLSTKFLFSDLYLEGIKNPGPLFHPEESWVSCHDEVLTAANEKSENALILTPALLRFYNPEGELQASDLLDNNSDAAIDDRKGEICSLQRINIGCLQQ